jgi:hypothetical protein
MAPHGQALALETSDGVSLRDRLDPYSFNVASKMPRLAAAADGRPSGKGGRIPQAGRRIATPDQEWGLDPKPAPYRDVRPW